MKPDQILSNHVLSDRPSMSWHMAKPGTTHYAYSVTWTPGTLAIAGDIGNFAVNHWQAMKTLPDTLDWLDGIDFSYLMEKSNTQKEFNADETAKFIVRCANEDAIRSIQCLRDEWRDYRSICGEKPDFAKKPRSLAVINGRPPEGWGMWHTIWTKLDGSGSPDAIFKTDGRWFLKQRLLEEVQTPDGAGYFCRSIGLDDYYGSYSYSYQCRLYFAAIKRWRDAVVLTMESQA